MDSTYVFADGRGDIVGLVCHAGRPRRRNAVCLRGYRSVPVLGTAFAVAAGLANGSDEDNEKSDCQDFHFKVSI
jgi:hypothetical protein